MFKDFAAREKTSVDWFFGFKLHIVVNEHGEILNVILTPGNIDDRKPIPDLLNAYCHQPKNLVSIWTGFYPNLLKPNSDLVGLPLSCNIYPSILKKVLKILDCLTLHIYAGSPKYWLV